ncbi:hypothetical protein LX36DRAFT_324250 [Colletotrichum falcatum]|nr:hypothetical protein LX36DRAFT_324250 [Colletotrichum falcatum]
MRRPNRTIPSRSNRTWRCRPRPSEYEIKRLELGGPAFAWGGREFAHRAPHARQVAAEARAASAASPGSIGNDELSGHRVGVRASSVGGAHQRRHRTDVGPRGGAGPAAPARRGFRQRGGDSAVRLSDRCGETRGRLQQRRQLSGGRRDRRQHGACPCGGAAPGSKTQR